MARFTRRLDRIISGIGCRHVVVADGDETLSAEDTSRIFFELSGDEMLYARIRNIFRTIGTGYDAFYAAAQLYSGIDPASYSERCVQAAGKAEMRPGWAEFIRSCPSVIVVTSGIARIWEAVIRGNGWGNVALVGGSHFSFDDYIVDSAVKARVVEKLAAAGKKVLAFGDSSMDARMLEAADIGCVVMRNKGEPLLAKALCGRKNVYQLKGNGPEYPGIPVSTFSELRGQFLRQARRRHE
ncbi:MAG: hypothetical protein A2089_12630 [Elusimicrobia bacterium GWD2_63_28]|nr:MAG: hypothetical protein A2089_12630 [Elusimicrobia bacterium GWD2_63_28]